MLGGVREGEVLATLSPPHSACALAPLRGGEVAGGEWGRPSQFFLFLQAPRQPSTKQAVSARGRPGLIPGFPKGGHIFFVWNVGPGLGEHPRLWSQAAAAAEKQYQQQQ